MGHIDERELQAQGGSEKPLYYYPILLSPGVTDGKPDTPRTDLTD